VTRLGGAWLGAAGAAGLGMAWHGGARLGAAGYGRVWHGMAGQAWHGTARRGRAGPGMALGMGYYALPDTPVQVYARNGGRRRRDQLAYLIREHEKLLAEETARNP